MSRLYKHIPYNVCRRYTYAIVFCANSEVTKLVYRYEFTREGLEAVEYDPEFQLVRPLNFYVRAKRRTTWPNPSAR